MDPIHPRIKSSFYGGAVATFGWGMVEWLGHVSPPAVVVASSVTLLGALVGWAVPPRWWDRTPDPPA